MNLQEFENALHRLLDDAVASGLDAGEVNDVAEAIVNNYFLDDDCEDAPGSPPAHTQ